jgi:hypothetical protein
VWRDTKQPPAGPNAPHACAVNPGWYPLDQFDVVAFDEQENPTNLCAAVTCFPIATGRYRTDAANPYGGNLGLTAPFGWLYLNLNNTEVNANLPANVAQAWVSPIMDAQGRFSVGFKATALDNASSASAGGGIIFP